MSPESRRKFAENHGAPSVLTGNGPASVAEFRLLVMPGWRICMQDLRLVGVHDDGEHLLLSGAGGEMFQLPIDEALRVAASRTTAKAASVAAAAPYCHVSARYPGADPQRSSRRPRWRSSPEFRSRKSSATRVRSSPSASTSPSRPARWRLPPPPPATTCTVPCSVTTRRRSATWWTTGSGRTASKPQRVEWDSWRRPDGSWNVVARFEAKPGGPTGIGEEPPAMWTFSPGPEVPAERQPLGPAAQRT